MSVQSWLVLGDSFIQEMYRYLRPPLGDRVSADVIARDDATYEYWNYGGTPGAVQGQSRNGVQIYVQEVQPDVTVFVLGTYPSSPALPPNFENDVRFAVSEAARYSGQVVLVGPFGNDPAGKRLAALRRVVPDAIDGGALAADLPHLSDGVRLTADGYRELANRLVTAIFTVLEQRAAKPPAETPPSPEVPITTTTTPTDVSETPPPADVDTTSGAPLRFRLGKTYFRPPVPAQPDTAKTEPEGAAGGAQPTPKSKWPLVVGGLVVAGIVGLGVYFYVRRKK